MAFPLTFCDEHGLLRRFPWSSYPEIMALPRVAEWCAVAANEPPTVTPINVVKVWCGPPATAPLPPTADEFFEGLLRGGWL